MARTICLGLTVSFLPRQVALLSSNNSVDLPTWERGSLDVSTSSLLQLLPQGYRSCLISFSLLPSFILPSYAGIFPFWVSKVLSQCSAGSPCQLFHCRCILMLLWAEMNSTSSYSSAILTPWCDFKGVVFYIPFLIFHCYCKEMQLICDC